MICKWSSNFVANNYWRGGWRSRFSSFLNRLGNAIAAYRDMAEVFKKKQILEDALEEIANWDNYNLGGDIKYGYKHPANIAEDALKTMRE